MNNLRSHCPIYSAHGRLEVQNDIDEIGRVIKQNRYCRKCLNGYNTLDYYYAGFQLNCNLACVEEAYFNLSDIYSDKLILDLPQSIINSHPYKIHIKFHYDDSEWVCTCKIRNSNMFHIRGKYKDTRLIDSKFFHSIKINQIDDLDISYEAMPQIINKFGL